MANSKDNIYSLNVCPAKRSPDPYNLKSSFLSHNNEGHLSLFLIQSSYHFFGRPETMNSFNALFAINR